MTTLSIVRAFGAQLCEAPDPAPRWPETAVVPVAAVAAAGLIAVFSAGGSTEPALAVSRGEDSVTLELREPAAGARELTRQLHEAGVRGRVLTVPTSTPSVGEWLAATRVARTAGAGATLPLAPDAKPPSCPDLAAAEPVRGAAVDGTTMTMPAAAAGGDVVLLVGRAATPAEQRSEGVTVSRNGDGDTVLRCPA